MRERRGQLFNRRRFGDSQPEEDVQTTLTNIVRKEFNDLTSMNWKTNTEAFNSVFDSPLEVEEALELEAEIVAEEGLSHFIHLSIKFINEPKKLVVQKKRTNFDQIFGLLLY